MERPETMTVAAQRSAAAFYLPASLGPVEVMDLATIPLAAGPLVLRAPRPTPTLLQATMDHLAAAHARYLACRTLPEIITSLARVGTYWADASSPARRVAEALLPAVTGYTPAMIALTLDQMAACFAPAVMERILVREVGSVTALDTFQPRRAGEGLTRGYGPAVVTHLFAGNVPGIAACSLLYAFLVKAASLGKTASADPLFPALFAHTLAELDPELGECLAVLPWKGGDVEVEAVALRAADALIVYGSTATIDSVRTRVPATTPFLGYGHKVSCGVIGRETLSAAQGQDTARRAAYDVSVFDQQGCLSPHVFYVEEGGDLSPSAFVRLLAQEMDAFERRVPRGRVTAAEAASIHQLRSTYEFRSFEDPRVVLYESPKGTAWTVVLDPTPAFEASCLNRTVRVKPIGDIGEVPGLVRPIRRLLQTVGVSLAPERVLALAAELGALGAARICPLGRMSAPPLDWYHDGRPNLADLLRWVDIEVG